MPARTLLLPCMPPTVHATPCLLISFLSLAFQTLSPCALSMVQGSWQSDVFSAVWLFTACSFLVCPPSMNSYTISPLNLLFFFLQPTQIMMVVGRDISETISHLRAAFQYLHEPLLGRNSKSTHLADIPLCSQIFPATWKAAKRQGPKEAKREFAEFVYAP